MTEKKEEPVQVDSGQDQNYDPQQEVKVAGQWKLVDLPEVAPVTGQEQDEVVAKFRSKIYRWRGQWKERGVGQLKFLRNKKTQLVRVLVRAQKTHKIVLNHFLQKKDIFCQLQQMKTSKNAWTWAAYDVSDDKPESQKFCAKFTSQEDFKKFQQEFENYCKTNGEKFKQTTEKKEQQSAEPKTEEQKKQ